MARIFGTSRGDTLSGFGGDDEIWGLGGDDIIDGGRGRDAIDAGDGNDLVYFEMNDRSVAGGAGIDMGVADFRSARQDLNFSVADNLAGVANVAGTRISGFEQIRFQAGRGDDRLTGGNLDDLLDGGAGSDTLIGGGGRDYLYGGDGNDRLEGGSGDDTMYGGAGMDTLKGGGGNDYLDGGAGIDRAHFSGGLHDFTAERLANGSIRITDLRSGAPEGIDIVRDVEMFTFNDAIVSAEQLLRAIGNHAPQAVADAVTVSENSASVQLNLLANDSDPDAGDTIGVVAVETTNTRGQVTLNPDGTVVYSANGQYDWLRAGQTATDTFSYTINDSAGRASRATVTVTIQGSNDGPVAVADAATVAADGSVTINALANDYDVDRGDVLTLVSVQGSTGTATVGPEKAIVYTAGDAFRSLAAGEVATDTFTYTVRDSAFGSTPISSQGSVTVTVVGVNDGPTAVNDAVTARHTGVTQIGSVLANDFDVDHGDTISVVAAQGTTASGASYTIDAQGHVSYDAGDIFGGLGQGQTAADSFTYTIVDSHGATSTATVNLTIGGPTITLDPRLAVHIEEHMQEGDVTDNIFHLLSEQAGVFGPGASIVAIGDPTKGDVTYDLAAHSLSFSSDTRDLDYLLSGDTIASPTFTYTVRDAAGGLHYGEVKLHVFGVDDAAVAHDDSLTATEGQILNLFELVLGNDDPDSRMIDFIAFDTTGTAGTISYSAPGGGVVAYVASGANMPDLAPGEVFVDHFTYTIRDRGMAGNENHVSSATVTVTITGAADGSFDVETALADDFQFAPVEDAGLPSPELTQHWSGTMDLMI